MHRRCEGTLQLQAAKHYSKADLLVVPQLLVRHLTCTLWNEAFLIKLTRIILCLHRCRLPPLKHVASDAVANKAIHAVATIDVAFDSEFSAQ